MRPIKDKISTNKESSNDKEELGKEEKILKELKSINKRQKQILSKYAIKYRILAGIANGFGTVIGATVGVSLFVFILGQLTNFSFLEPIVTNILDIIRRNE
jgi:ABC-type methionine transport system permease subunit